MNRLPRVSLSCCSLRRKVLQISFRTAICFLLVNAAIANDQPWQALGKVSAVRTLPNGVEVRAGAAVARVVAVTESVVRVRVSPDGKFPKDESWAVLPEAVKSPPSVKVVESPTAVEFACTGGKVRIEKSPL